MAASHAHPRLGNGTGETSSRPRIQYLFTGGGYIAQNVADAAQSDSTEIGAEFGWGGWRRCPGADGPTFVEPFRQTAIEHRGGVVPKETHQPPSARRRRQALLIVEHYARLIVDAKRSKKLREAPWSGHHMRQLSIRIGDLVDIEIPRAGDVSADELGRSIFRLVRQVFRRVEYH